MTKEESPRRWPISPLNAEWSLHSCLRDLGNLIQDRVETWQRPSRKEEDDQRPDYAEIVEHRFWNSFDRQLECDLAIVDFERAIVSLRVIAPETADDVSEKIGRLSSRIPMSESDTAEELIIEMANTALYLHQVAYEIGELSRGETDPSDPRLVAKTTQPQAENTYDDRSSGEPGRSVTTVEGEKPRRMKWQVAAEIMLEMRNRGEPFTSQINLAEKIRCSPATINKAIARDADLSEWAEKQRGSATGMDGLDGIVADTAIQTREADPSELLESDDIDKAMDFLLEQAEPEERERIEAMEPARRRKLAETSYRDPDLAEQIMRRKQKKQIDS